MEYTGLTSTDAAARLKKYGPNLIKEPGKISALRLFINQFLNPLIFILIAAAILALVLGEVLDATFILVVVLINATLGFFQEYKAENILHTLKEKVSKQVKVIRDSQRQMIPVASLVPGDIIILEPGLKIPGDGRILEAEELLVNESILTGESEPVLKKRAQDAKTEKETKIFMGTLVIEGLGVGVIESTGDDTQFGKIASSLESKFDPPTPIKIELTRISNLILLFVSVIIMIIVALGVRNGLSFDEIFFTAIALGVSTIPEGLIISLTVTLAIGMNNIMSKKAIVRSLPAAETIGSIEILCVDKTGTLTLGQMNVVKTDFVDHDEALNTLAICNNQNNFIDQAILKFLSREKTVHWVKERQQQRQHLFPFSSTLKYTAAAGNGKIYVVGAPEKVLQMTKTQSKDSWNSKIKAYAGEGFRMVGLAVKNSPTDKFNRADLKDMTMLGLVLIKDPVRKTAIKHLARITKAGIGIKVITGDLKETSLKVLQDLNFTITDDEIISGEELRRITDQQNFAETVSRIKLFYRTTPDQKLDIVKAIQAKNKIVGMMGDGVNDSPAIKNAEIGIVVDNATDVSKEVADVILLDSNFQTILEAIKEGRNIFQNLRKIMVFLFANSLLETGLILLSLIFQLPLPLLPLQILWINLIEDGLPSLALSFDRSGTDLLKNKPRSKNTSIFDKNVIAVIVIISFIIDIIYFLLYNYMINNNYDLIKARTIMFTGISITSLLFLFSAKTLDSNIWKENIFNNRFLNVSVLTGLCLLFISISWQPVMNLLGTVSLSMEELLLIFALSSFDLIMIEAGKLLKRKLSRG